MDLVFEKMLRDMSEGAVLIGFDGKVKFINRAARTILGLNDENLTERTFAQCFIQYPENDAFNQTVLDALYDTAATHRCTVSYYDGIAFKQLNISTAFLQDDFKKIGIILVINDISELTELRDAAKTAEKISKLNQQLEMRNKLLTETFGRFLSDDIVRQLLDTPHGLELGGCSKELTVIKSDLRGFTALSERIDADRLLYMLNHYLAEMTEVIRKYNGTIIEFMGDGILVVFGAPVYSETHAADAIAASIAMQNCMPAVNQWNKDNGFPELLMGIAAVTGQMIIGNIGSVKRTKYGVIGNRVNLCGRIESYTVGGQILISPRTRELAAVPLTIEKEIEILPKGETVTIKISDVTGIGEPYNLSCATYNEPPKTLKTPIQIRFSQIEDKHVSTHLEDGSILALSKTDVLLNTDVKLKPFDNIVIEIGGKLYAKVLSADSTGTLLRLTGFPEGFERWFNAHIDE
ncbi:MAG: PAS domain S-box protein [Erysipelotrichia bacterium]|nr:PAS domain S-box protein [Erysipelotrichia bacterium]